MCCCSDLIAPPSPRLFSVPFFSSRTPCVWPPFRSFRKSDSRADEPGSFSLATHAWRRARFGRSSEPAHNLSFSGTFGSKPRVSAPLPFNLSQAHPSPMHAYPRIRTPYLRCLNLSLSASRDQQLSTFFFFPAILPYWPPEPSFFRNMSCLLFLAPAPFPHPPCVASDLAMVAPYITSLRSSMKPEVAHECPPRPFPRRSLGAGRPARAKRSWVQIALTRFKPVLG